MNQSSLRTKAMREWRRANAQCVTCARPSVAYRCDDCKASRKTYPRKSPKQARFQTPEYQAWSQMRARCLNPKHKRFASYGGRGITICSAWDSFDAFLADMGPRPSPSHSLDRIDNDLLIDSYSKANCRWATDSEQNANRRRGRMARKLNADLVNEILGRLEHGEPQRSVAKRMGVAAGTISSIVAGDCWKDVAR